jgi:polyisoprenoid-binding protein YceI
LLQGNFNLQSKQTTRAVTMAITITEKGNLLEMNGTFTINRKHFGVGGNSMTLSDNVDIFVHAVFEK